MTVAVRKGPEAFRSISEASSEIGVPQHVLRFWETKFAFVRPTKRAGGRRFYRPQDVQVLKRVRALLQEEGYTIKGVQKLHRDGGLRRLGADAEADVAEVPPPEAAPHADAAEPPGPDTPPRVLDAAARGRLADVLRDLETTKAGIDALLARAADC